MGNKIIDFSYRVRGNFSPNGLQKVFFSFYPGDTARMENIADDILDISNCAVWYHTDSQMADDIDLDDFGMKLQEMKLFVVIVSTNYLANDSLAKNWEYGFTMEHHIPILPIAVESGLEEYFAVEMNRICDGYGDIQSAAVCFGLSLAHRWVWSIAYPPALKTCSCWKCCRSRYR